MPFYYFFFIETGGWWLVVRGSHTPTAVLQDNSAVLVFTGVDIPVEANGIDNGLARSATDES